MKKQIQQHKQRGFTLIEIMVVVVILGILAAFVVPNLMDKPVQAKITKAKSDISSIEAALDLYRLDNHRYPATDEGLESLIDKPADAPAWKEGGYLKKLPNDPWGKPYQYLNPGVQSTVDVFSYGADGAEGGEGANADIGNWMIE